MVDYKESDKKNGTNQFNETEFENIRTKYAGECAAEEEELYKKAELTD